MKRFSANLIILLSVHIFNYISPFCGSSFAPQIRADISNHSRRDISQTLFEKHWLCRLIASQKQTPDIQKFFRCQPRQSYIRQLNQQYLKKNRQDLSRINPLAREKFHDYNYHKASSIWSKPIMTNDNHIDMLPDLETIQLDPIYQSKQPSQNLNGSQSVSDIFSIDLLNFQPNRLDNPSIKPVGNMATTIQSLAKFQKPLFFSYLAALVNITKMISRDEADCFLAVQILPSILINSFLDAITMINKIQGLNVLAVPLLLLSAINMMISFIFLDEYCPALN